MAIPTSSGGFATSRSSRSGPAGLRRVRRWGRVVLGRPGRDVASPRRLADQRPRPGQHGECAVVRRRPRHLGNPGTTGRRRRVGRHRGAVGHEQRPERDDRGSSPAGPDRRLGRGVGFLNRDPAIAGGAWTIVKGARPPPTPTRCGAQNFYRITADPGTRTSSSPRPPRASTSGRPGGTWTKIAGSSRASDTQPLDVVLTRLPAGVTRLGGDGEKRAGRRVPAAAGHGHQPGRARVQVGRAAQRVPRTRRRPARRHLPPTRDRRDQGLRARPQRADRRARTNPPAAIWTINATAAIGAARISGITATLLNGTPPTCSCPPVTSPVTTCASPPTRRRPDASTSAAPRRHVVRLERRDLPVRHHGDRRQPDDDRRRHALGRPRAAGRPAATERRHQAHRVDRHRRRPVPVRRRRRFRHVRQPQRRRRGAATGVHRQPPDQPGHRRRGLPGQRHRGPHR